MRRGQKMLRVTVREDFSYELATDLVNDLKTVVDWLDHHFIYSGMVPTSLSARTLSLTMLIYLHTGRAHKSIASKLLLGLAALYSVLWCAKNHACLLAFSAHHAAGPYMRLALCAEEKMHELRSKWQPHHPSKAKQHKHLHQNNKKRTGVC